MLMTRLFLSSSLYLLLSWMSVVSFAFVSVPYHGGATPITLGLLRASPQDSASLLVQQQQQQQQERQRRQNFWTTAVPGPSVDTKPDYDNIVGPLGRLADDVFLHLFRQELARQVEQDSSKPGYDAIIDLTLQLNQKFTNRTEIHRRAQTVLRNLFPSWMPGSYAILFSKPFPAFSSRMNAWATKVGGTWLMGECEINDVPVDGGKIGTNQGLLVKRCRFLEESGCASVCVNSCQIPTQQFFLQDMGLPLTMEPNYETYECQFSFGRTPDAATQALAQNTPCLQRCPTAGSLRQYHTTSTATTTTTTTTTATTTTTPNGNQVDSSSSLSSPPSSSMCPLMNE